MLRLLSLAALVVVTGAAQTSPVVSLDAEQGEFRVAGSAILSQLNNPNLKAIFQVAVDQPGAPPLTGTYRVADGAVVFKPQFPVEPGVTYRANFKLASEVATGKFTVPKPVVEPTTVVERVYPTTSRLPENQLKFYIHFSGPMNRGSATRKIHLIDDSGKEVELPFLRLDEELWDREYRRLTVLFDPGRIKRDLVPNREVGPPLKEGRSYTLVIDRDWIDARGAPLKEAFRKQFTVGPADRTPLEPKTWTVTSPAPNTSAPVILDFPEPIDVALLHRFIEVLNARGDPVDGKVTVDREETRWTFTPDAAWTPGTYKLEIITTLEDLAGNKIGRAFDVDSFEQVDRQITSSSYSVPFKVAPQQ